ncbi:MAG: hypothetical protein GY946_20885, partial [bacterium]|nr:hypothetical protein [bacterium]
MTSSTDLHPLAEFGPAGRQILLMLERDRLAPSLLLEGSDPEALRAVGLELAAAILRTYPGGVDHPDAHARTLNQSHPDLHLLERDKATVISVAALSAMLEQAHQTPFESARQVFLVDPADALDAAGVARYLKALEEPPAHTVFILLSTHAERLPDTVLGRCQRFRLPPPSPARISERLLREGLGAEHTERLARISSGSLSRALRMTHSDALGSLDLLLTSAFDQRGCVLQGVDSVLTVLDHAAKAAAEHAEGPDLRRQFLRDHLSDLLHALLV